MNAKGKGGKSNIVRVPLQVVGTDLTVKIDETYFNDVKRADDLWGEKKYDDFRDYVSWLNQKQLYQWGIWANALISRKANQPSALKNDNISLMRKKAGLITKWLISGDKNIRAKARAIKNMDAEQFAAEEVKYNEGKAAPPPMGVEEGDVRERKQELDDDTKVVLELNLQRAEEKLGGDAFEEFEGSGADIIGEDANISIFFSRDDEKKNEPREAKQDSRSGYAYTDRGGLPGNVVRILNRIIDKYRNSEFKLEFLKPLKDEFPRDSIEIRDLKGVGENIVGAEDEKLPVEERENLIQKKIKDITLEVYASKIRRFIIEQDIWHGPRFEEQVKALAASEVKEIKDGYEKFIQLEPYLRYRNQIYVRKNRGLGKRLSKWEEQLEKLDLIPAELAKFNVNFFAEEGENLRERIRLWRKQRTEKRLKESFIEVKDPSGFMYQILNGFFDDDPRGVRLYLALLLACGRRPADIVGTGCFAPVREGDGDPTERYECWAWTPLKPGLNLYKKTDIIPLLVPYKVFVNGLRRFRTMWGHSDPSNWVTRTNFTDTAYRMAYDISKHLVTLRNKSDKITSRDFRALYARYSIAIFGEGRHYNLWIKNVLMHSSIETSLNYSRVQFPTDNMQRVQRWIMTGDRRTVDRNLEALLQRAKTRSTDKNAQWDKNNWDNLRCLGMTREEALSKAATDREKEIVEEIWSRVGFTESKVDDLVVLGTGVGKKKRKK